MPCPHCGDPYAPDLEPCDLCQRQIAQMSDPEKRDPYAEAWGLELDEALLEEVEAECR